MMIKFLSFGTLSILRTQPAYFQEVRLSKKPGDIYLVFETAYNKDQA